MKSFEFCNESAEVSVGDVYKETTEYFKCLTEELNTLQYWCNKKRNFYGAFLAFNSILFWVNAFSLTRMNKVVCFSFMLVCSAFISFLWIQFTVRCECLKRIEGMQSFSKMYPNLCIDKPADCCMLVKYLVANVGMLSDVYKSMLSIENEIGVSIRSGMGRNFIEFYYNFIVSMAQSQYTELVDLKYQEGAFQLKFCDLNGTMYTLATSAEYKYSSATMLCFDGKKFIVEAPSNKVK